MCSTQVKHMGHHGEMNSSQIGITHLRASFCSFGTAPDTVSEDPSAHSGCADHDGPQRTTADLEGLFFGMSQNVPQHAFSIDVTQSHGTQLEEGFCKRKRLFEIHLGRCAQKQTFVPLKKNIKQKKKGHNGPQQTTVGIPRNSTTFFLLKT